MGFKGNAQAFEVLPPPHLPGMLPQCSQISLPGPPPPRVSC